MKLYGLKSCDTCRRAEKALRGAGHDPKRVDVREDGLSEAERARFIAVFGDDLLNRRSTTWRNLDATAREADPATLLAAHPALMKRPVIAHEGRLYLGWGDDVRSDLLG